MTNANRRSTFANIEDTANGEMATTRPNTIDNGIRVTVSDVYLSEDLLRAMLYMNDRFGTIIVNAIAGGEHSGGLRDEHLRGLAVDFSVNSTVNSIVYPSLSVNNNISTGNRTTILDYLEKERNFLTQRNVLREHWEPKGANLRPFAGADYVGDFWDRTVYPPRLIQSFHLSIWERTH